MKLQQNHPNCYFRTPQSDYLKFGIGLIKIKNIVRCISVVHMNEIRKMLQWRNRLARGTYIAVLVRNAKVVSSSLTWNNVFDFMV